MTTTLERFCNKIISDGLIIEKAKREAINNFNDIYPVYKLSSGTYFIPELF